MCSNSCNTCVNQLLQLHLPSFKRSEKALLCRWLSISRTLRSSVLLLISWSNRTSTNSLSLWLWNSWNLCFSSTTNEYLKNWSMLILWSMYWLYLMRLILTSYQGCPYYIQQLLNSLTCMVASMENASVDKNIRSY